MVKCDNEKEPQRLFESKREWRRELEIRNVDRSVTCEVCLKISPESAAGP